MKRSEFLKKAGQTALGVGIIAIVFPQTVEGGDKK